MVSEYFHARPGNSIGYARRLVVPLALMLMLAGLSQARSEDTGKRYALLVGTGTYQQWSPLVNPIPDVRALAAELRHRYDFVPEVLENPVREEVIAKLRHYLQLEYGPKDQLVVVFAGHGTYDELSKIGYLVAKDSESRSRDPNFVSLLNYPWLLTLIDNVDCPNILLVIDACYSGSLEETGANGASDSAASEAPRRIRRFLTSGGIEYVTDGDPDKSTPFVRQLLAGLRSPAKGSVLTLEKLQKDFMGLVEPRPRFGRFGSDHGNGGFTFVATADGPAPRLELGGSTGTVPAPIAHTRLRSERVENLADGEIRRRFRFLSLFDVTRNPEGDFPNQFRVQTKGMYEVVADLESRLMWQRFGSDVQLSMDEARKYVDELNTRNHAGYNDWRLPTVEELASLLDPERKTGGLFISRYFGTEQDKCWTADYGEGSRPYYVSFNTGRVDQLYDKGTKHLGYFVRAVRTDS